MKVIKTLLAILLCTLASDYAIAVSLNTELHHKILNTDKAEAPYITNGTITFSFKGTRSTQAVSLALKNENYRRFHTFERNPNGIFILTLPVPENQLTIHYRLIVDGLWTIDPNAQTEIDSRGISVSKVSISQDSSMPKPGVSRKNNGLTRFIYAGIPGERVSVIGDFNNWDPYLSELNETSPGIFEIKMFLAPGKHYYRFVVNGQEITDPANTKTARNGWGKDSSVIP